MKYFTLLLVTIISIFFSGCLVSKTQEGPTLGEKVTHSSGESIGMAMNSVAILDKSLQRWVVFEETSDGSIHHESVGKIAVESSGAKRNSSGTLKVWAVLRNRTDYNLQVQARVQFFDEYKAPMEGPSTWQRLILPANSITAYKENSLGINDLKYYYIEVKEGS